MPEVKCSVSNCNFWKQGNNCGADMILIDIDQHAAENFSEEYATESFMAHQDEALESSSTCCHTFVPRE